MTSAKDLQSVRGCLKLFHIFVSLLIGALPVSADELKIAYTGRNSPPWSVDNISQVDYAFCRLVLGSPLDISPNYEIFPNIIESWRYDFLTRTYVISLRKGLKFHNGRAATAYDLEFTIARAFFSPLKNPIRNRYDGILGAEKVQPGSAFKSGGLEGLKVIDEYQMAVTLRKPNPSFLYNLTDSIDGLVPREELQDDYLTWKRFPVGVGPFAVVSVSNGNRQVKLKEVNGSRLIEFVTDDSLAKNADLLFGPALSPGSDYSQFVGKQVMGARVIYFNFWNRLGANVHFRRAVAMAIDRSSLPMTQGIESATTELLPPHFWGRGLNFPEFSLDKAKEEISKVPLELVRNGVEIWIDPGQAPSQDLVDALKKSIEKIGLKTSVVRISEMLPDASNSDLGLVISTRSVNVADPLRLYSAHRPGSHIKGFAPKSDEVFDQMYKAAADATDLEGKAKSVTELSQYFNSQVFLIPIFHRRPSVWYRPNRISKDTLMFSQRGLLAELVRLSDSK